IARAAEATENKLSALVEENRRLTAEVDGLRLEAGAALSRASEADTNEGALRERIQALSSELRQTRSQLRQTERAVRKLETRQAHSAAQLSKTGLDPVIGAPEAADLISTLLGDLHEVGGLDLQSGQVRLKFALAGSAERTGFVLPTTSTP